MNKMKRLFLIFSLLMIMCMASCGKQEAVFENSEETINDTENIQKLQDGEYTVAITMEGGTGKAYIQSPVNLVVSDGSMELTLVWSSVNYDYMIVDGVKYMNETPGSESTFTIPVQTIDEPLNVIGDTVAMSTPHEIEYVITFGEVTLIK